MPIPPRLGAVSKKAAVKRLCRDGDALLSRPGRGARCASPIAAISGDSQSAAERFKVARDQVSGTFMPQKVRIALDAMGGDVGASVVIPGAAISLTRHPDTEFLLFGDRALIEAELARHPALKAASPVRRSRRCGRPCAAIRSCSTSAQPLVVTRII